MNPIKESKAVPLLKVGDVIQSGSSIKPFKAGKWYVIARNLEGLYKFTKGRGQTVLSVLIDEMDKYVTTPDSQGHIDVVGFSKKYFEYYKDKDEYLKKLVSTKVGKVKF